MRAFFHRLAGLFGRDDARLTEEIQTHLDLLAADYIKQGLTPEQARQAARRSFGGVESMKEEYRDRRALPLVDVLRQDLRDAFRSCRRAPAVTASTVIALALGIGPATAIVAVADAVLVKPLPYPGIERMLALGSDNFGFGGAQTGQVVLYLRDRTPAFLRIAASRGGNGWNLLSSSGAEYVRGLAVTPGYFEVFGTQPLFGREFSDAESQPNGPAAVILSDAIWHRHFGARPDVIGEIVELGETAFSIVGVMPSSFRSIPAVDVWTALRISPGDNSLNYSVIGRLAGDATQEAANAALDAMKPAMARELAGTTRAFPRRVEEMSWRPYRSAVAAASAPILNLLLVSAAFVLVVACANVAALQLARVATRRREVAMRAALGCGPARAIRHLLTESALHGALGALVGVAVAAGFLAYLRPVLTEGFLLGQRVAIDWRVFATALSLALITAVVFGVWPAVKAARLDVGDALTKSGGRVAGTRSATRVRRTLVAAEVCLTGVLLVGAGMFGREMLSLLHVDVGFDPNHVVTAQTLLQGVDASTAPDRIALYDRVLRRMRELPGVEVAAATSNVPIERTLNLAIEAAGLVQEPRAMDWTYVTPDYFNVFQIKVRAGRLFGPDDAAGGASAIVNETFARGYFGTPGAAVGQTIQLVRAIPDRPRIIVGVVGDVHAASGAGWTSGHALGAPPSPLVYVPAAQLSDSLAQMVHRIAPVSWAVRIREDEATIIPALQQAIRDAAPQLPVIRFTNMATLIADSLALQRMLLTLVGIFSIVTLILAAVGIYGVVAYTVAQRRHEIGIRFALGATVARVLWGFAGEGFATGLVGCLSGLALAAFLSRFIATLFFGTSVLDFETYLIAGGVLLSVTALSSLIPSLRAGRVDPAEALRAE